MSTLLIDSIGYIALTTNLISMSAKGEYKLRFISLVANAMYILYGSLIHATPIIVGCTIAVFLHAYHIRRILLKKKK